MREHVDRVLHVVVQGQPVLDVEGVVQVTILKKNNLEGGSKIVEFFGESWETRFLDHFGPSRLSLTVLASLGYFGPLWTTLGQLWPNETFLGTPCK